MEEENYEEPKNIVEHFKRMLGQEGTYDEAIPDMFVEYFYQYVSQTLTIAHGNAIGTHLENHSTVLESDVNAGVMKTEIKVNEDQQQIMDKVNKIKEQPVEFNLTIEVVRPPEDVSLEGINYQFPKNQHHM